jgi:membrane protease YdiL (CAAX protease family)
MAEKKAEAATKDLAISFVGIVIAIILAVVALAIANAVAGALNIKALDEKAAALIAVAIMIGPAIAAFATKKYWKEGEAGIKDLIISVVGIVIAIILAVVALAIANAVAGALGIGGTTDGIYIAKDAALIAVAIIIGPTIGAFATKKYWKD